MRESSELAEQVIGKKMNSRSVEVSRIGDPICHNTGLRKMQSHYPAYGIGESPQLLFDEREVNCELRLAGPSA